MTPYSAKNALLKSRNEPGWWIESALGSHPWPIQQQIIEALLTNREVAVKSCHSAGKSWAAARAILWYLCCFPRSIVITTAPTDRQVRNILWREIRVAHKRAKLPIGGKLLTQSLEFDDDWWAVGFTAPDYDPDRFQGFHALYVLVVVDEASGVSDDIYEAIASILSGENAALLMIGNPTDEQTYFGKAFKIPGIKKITISAFDTPNFTHFGITLDDIRNGDWEEKIKGKLPYPTLITPQWVADRHKRWGEFTPMFQSRVLANFPPASPDGLIPLAWVEAAQNRNLEPGVLDKVELAVDVARFGSNDIEIYMRHGPILRHVNTFNGIDTMTTTGHVVTAAKQHGAEIIKVDVNGVGSGVVDRLVELVGDDLPADTAIIPINFGEGSSNPELRFQKKADYFWGLRTRFQDGDIDLDPEDEELAEQLTSIKYKPNSRGQIQILPKDKNKSPDKADATAIAFADESESLSQENIMTSPRLQSADVVW